MQKWIVNPKTPRPCPMAFEGIRKAAVEKWEYKAIGEEDILQWVRAGCPDLQGALLKAASREPPVPGQGVVDPRVFVDQLLGAGIFLSSGKSGQAVLA